MKKEFIIIIMLASFSKVVLGQKSFTYSKVDGSLIRKSLDLTSEKNIYIQGRQVSDYLPKNYTKSGKVDYTTFIQQAIDENRILVFPDFPVLVNDKGLKFRSGQQVLFPSNSKILLKSSSLPSYSIFRLESVENIELHGPKIIGDRDTHLEKNGEWGMGIRISASKNIKIVNADIRKCWGDGIYICDNKNLNSDGITISSSYFDYNRRNGITIASGTNIKINNTIVSNTYGAMPMAGIDIEPNNNDAIINNISIVGYKSLNNHNSGLQIGMSKIQGNKSKDINILANDIYISNAKYGLIVGSLHNKGSQGKITGRIQLNNIQVLSALLPIKVGFNYETGPRINFKNFEFFDYDGKENKGETSKFIKRVEQRKNIYIE